MEIGSLPTSADYLPALLHRHQQGRREAQISNNREAAISAFWAATSDEELAAAQAAYDAALDAEEAAKAERVLNDLKQARRKTPVFTGCQLVAILASFKAKPGFDAAQFLRRITTMVETYLLPSGADTRLSCLCRLNKNATWRRCEIVRVRSQTS